MSQYRSDDHENGDDKRGTGIRLLYSLLTHVSPILPFFETIKVAFLDERGYAVATSRVNTLKRRIVNENVLKTP